MNKTRPDITEAKLIRREGEIELDLKPITSLPFVSVLTITKNRSHFFPLSLHNWNNFRYPKDRIEWVIVDDSKTDELKDLIPSDDRIRYYHLPVPLPIADKRNYSVKKCKGTIISHMDDDDFYFSDSVLAKVRILIDYPDKDCVFSLPLGVHDIIEDKGGTLQTSGNDIPEASMTYRKSFWKRGKFGRGEDSSEWYKFCTGRWDRLINIPFWFNMIAITHKNNATGGVRRLNVPTKESVNFYKVWDKKTKRVIKGLVEMINKK